MKAATVDPRNVIGLEPMNRKQLYNFLLQNGVPVSMDQNTGVVMSYGEKLTDQNMLNLANNRRERSGKPKFMLVAA